jgi:hypothetical protein
MADNVNITAGVGTTVSTDDIGGGVQVQNVKIMDGTSGGSTPAVVSSNGGLNIVGVQTANSTASWTSATGSNTALTLTLTNLNVVSVGIVTTSTFTGGVVTFEVSPDNSNWFPVQCARIDSYTVESTYTFVASTVRAWSTSVDAFSFFRVRLSTVITGSGTATVIAAAQTMPIEPVVSVGDGSVKPTYRAATAAALVAAAGTAPFFAIQGSSTKTIKVQRIEISGLTLTAVAYLNINAAKYSTAVSAGTATALTKVPDDSLAPAATANLVNVYTAAPTAGTKVGDIDSKRIMGQSTTAAAAGIPDIVTFDYRSVAFGMHPPVLRGTAEGFALYFNSAPATAVTMSLWVEWTEE